MRIKQKNVEVNRTTQWRREKTKAGRAGQATRRHTRKGGEICLRSASNERSAADSVAVHERRVQRGGLIDECAVVRSWSGLASADSAQPVTDD